jgi:hypothetical protein
LHGRSFIEEELIIDHPIKDMDRWSSGSAVVQKQKRQEGFSRRLMGRKNRRARRGGCGISNFSWKFANCREIKERRKTKGRGNKGQE